MVLVAKKILQTVIIKSVYRILFFCLVMCFDYVNLQYNCKFT